jgi:endoglycosylceramidase
MPHAVREELGTRRLVVATVVVAAVIALLMPIAGARAQSDGFVQAPGGPFLVDAQGRRLELHGVDLVPKCATDTQDSSAPGSPCLPGGNDTQPGYVLTPDASDPGRRFTAKDAATLSRLGFSVVRLGIIWAGLEPGPPGVQANDPTYCSPHLPGTPFPSLGADDPYNQATVNAYLDKVGVIISLLARVHIRVLLDMHQDGWGQPFANPTSATPWMAEGAPAWATCTSGAPFEAPPSWQSAYTDPAVNAAFQHFWANDVSGDLQGQYVRALAAVAQHFAGNRDVLGYELFNEPSAPTSATPPAFDRQLQCFYAGSLYAPVSCATAAGPSQAPPQGAIPAVLAADPNHLVFYEAPVLTDYGAPETIGIAEPLPFGRLVLSFHDYGGVPGTNSFDCEEPTCSTQEQAVMSLFSQERGATRTSQPGGPAWLLSEFGAETYAPDIANVAQLADRNLLSWIYWAAFQLHDPTGGPGEGLLDEQTRQPDAARAAVLSRTYPLATAGVPIAQSFSTTTGAFDFSYRADLNVHAPSEIEVPTAYHYPHGYDVSVRGARVTSRADAPLLTVVNDPGASTVTVSITARARSRQAPARRRAKRHHHRRRSSHPSFTG